MTENRRGSGSSFPFAIPGSAEDDAHFYVRGRSGWSRHGQGKTIAVLNARRDDEPHGMAAQSFAAAFARRALI